MHHSWISHFLQSMISYTVVFRQFEVLTKNWSGENLETLLIDSNWFVLINWVSD